MTAPFFHDIEMHADRHEDLERLRAELADDDEEELPPIIILEPEPDDEPDPDNDPDNDPFTLPVAA